MENQQLERPRSVTVALYLLWASLAITVVRFAVGYGALAPGTNLQLTLAVIIGTLVVYVFLIFMMSYGRNWARIVFLVLFLAGLVPSLPTLLANFGQSAVVGVGSLADLVLQAWALFLMFTSPGSAWFRKKEPTPAA